MNKTTIIVFCRAVKWISDPYSLPPVLVVKLRSKCPVCYKNVNISVAAWPDPPIKTSLAEAFKEVKRNSELDEAASICIGCERVRTNFK